MQTSLKMFLWCPHVGVILLQGAYGDFLKGPVILIQEHACRNLTVLNIIIALQSWGQKGC